MTATQATDRYTIITADSHCGGSHAQYREYLDSKYHDDFDAWREKYKNPYKDLKDTKLRTRNWDPELRWTSSCTTTASSARSSSPTPCRRSSRASCCSPSRRARGVRAPPRRGAGAQPLARRLLRAEARGPRRHRSDLPQRSRRRHRRRAVDQGAQPARRRAGREPADHRRLAEADVRPVLRPALAGVRRPRCGGEHALRHRRSALPDGTGRRRSCTSTR